MYLTSNFSFLCRKSKADRSGHSPVELSVIINGERTYISLPMKCKPDEFSALRSQKRSNWLKDYLSTIYANIQRLIGEMSVCGVVITAKSLKDAYINGICITYSLSSLKKEYLDIIKGRSGYETYRRYELAFDLFLTVIDGGTEVGRVSNGDILRYQNIVSSKYDSATAYGYMMRLKSFFIYAVNNGRIRVNPFSGIRLKRAKKNVETITVDEYERMRDKVFSIERLDRVRDFFVFAANTGLSYCDVKGLQKDDFSLVDGRWVIRKERQKTGVEFFSVVLDDGVKILEKYDWDISSIVLSNQKLNAYAREIQDLCGIVSCALTCHKMRHYYITSLVRAGTPISIVQKCAGHSNIRQTISYSHLVASDVVQAVSQCLPC